MDLRLSPYDFDEDGSAPTAVEDEAIDESTSADDSARNSGAEDGRVDVAAERERALGQRAGREKEARTRSRAKQILYGNWNSDRVLLQEHARHLYPNVRGDELEQLLDIAIDLQKTERKRIDPKTVRVRPPEPEEKLKRDYSRRDDDPFEPPVRFPRPSAPKRERHPRKKKEVVVAAATDKPESSLAEKEKPRLVDNFSDELWKKVVAVRATVMKGPKPTPAKIREALLRELNIEITGNRAHYLRYSFNGGNPSATKKAKGRKGKAAPASRSKGAPASPVKPKPPKIDFETADRATLERVLKNPAIGDSCRTKIEARLAELRTQQEQKVAEPAAASAPAEKLEPGDPVEAAPLERPDSAAPEKLKEFIHLDQAGTGCRLTADLHFDEVADGARVAAWLFAALAKQPTGELSNV